MVQPACVLAASGERLILLYPEQDIRASSTDGAKKRQKGVGNYLHNIFSYSLLNKPSDCWIQVVHNVLSVYSFRVETATG
jgi:hypothetical protein